MLDDLPLTEEQALRIVLWRESYGAYAPAVTAQPKLGANTPWLPAPDRSAYWRAVWRDRRDRERLEDAAYG